MEEERQRVEKSLLDSAFSHWPFMADDGPELGVASVKPSRLQAFSVAMVIFFTFFLLTGKL